MACTTKKKWIKSAFGCANDSATMSSQTSVSLPEPPSKRSKTRSSLDEQTTDVTSSPPSTQSMARVPMKCKDITSSNWVENFTPGSINDLAIHVKKIEELEHWLKQSDANRSQRPGPILLITGPSGSGKTATLHLLAKARGFAVNEWINPVDVEHQRHHKNDAFRDDDNNAFSEKQTDQFSQFLFRASRYTSLFEESSRRLVLVEDFPNLYLKDNAAFHEVLEHYGDYGKSPLVFIVTDTKSTKLNLAYNLFGDQVRQKYQIDQISFNAVSTTLLKKGLKRICAIMQQPEFSRHYKQLPADCVDSIIISAQGDIRNAVINLHFAAQKNSGTMQLEGCVASSTSSRSKAKPKNKKLAALGCDETITMMHALGRVLNPKYQESNDQLLAHSPERLADDFMSQPFNFMSLLHANYMCHFRDIEDVVASADMLSSTDVVMNEWRDDAFAQLGLNMAIRGVMVCNRHPASGWMPIKGLKKKTSTKPEEELRTHFGISGSVSANVLGADYRTFAHIIRAKQALA